MTGFTYLVWQAAAFIFLLVMAYAFFKRPLWFPGLVCAGSATFTGIRLTPDAWGPIRIFHVILVAGILLSLMLRIEPVLPKRRSYASLERLKSAALLSFGLLVLVLLRLAVDYYRTGVQFYPLEIRDLVSESLIPCGVLLACRYHHDPFPELLRGLTIGSLLALLPALTDLGTVVEIWSDFLYGPTIGFHAFLYRDRNSLAYWAFQAAVGLYCLSTQKMGPTRRRCYLVAVGCLSVFALANQSRRVFVSLGVVAVGYFVLWFRKSNTAFRGSTGVLALVALVFLTWLTVTRFQRFSSDEFASELDRTGAQEGSVSRADLFVMAIDTFLQQPLLGPGLADTGSQSDPMYTESGEIGFRHIGFHNTFADILVGYGIVGGMGAILFLALMLPPLVSLRRLPSHVVRNEISLLAIFWIGLLPAAFLGGIYPEQPGLLALLPCGICTIIICREHMPQPALRQKELAAQLRRYSPTA